MWYSATPDLLDPDILSAAARTAADTAIRAAARRLYFDIVAWLAAIDAEVAVYGPHVIAEAERITQAAMTGRIA